MACLPAGHHRHRSSSTGKVRRLPLHTHPQLLGIAPETEEVVQRFLSRPEEYDADTCGPGPFSLGNPETTRGILEAAGFAEIALDRRDFDYFMGADMDEAIESLLAIGPGAELNGAGVFYCLLYTSIPTT